jgi:uncharacterized protein (DUF305 family)
MSSPTEPDLATPSAGAAERDDDRDGDGDAVVLPWWQHPVNILVIVVTAALLAGMTGWLIGDAGGDIDSSDVDVGFLHDMRLHHEQAVEMSLTYLGRPEVGRGIVPVARSIAFGQALEIGLMIQLLVDMDAPLTPEDDQVMAWMGTPLPEDEMPGMAGEAELDELASAEGAAADELYLELMIDHHEGGLHMLEFAADEAANADVRRYAAAWAEAQSDEIRELEALRPG